MTDAPVADPTAYEPPKVWTWNKGSGGRFASINRPPLPLFQVHTFGGS